MEAVDVVKVFNDAMKQLSDVASQETPALLTFQLKKDWDAASKGEKKECIKVASEACQMICNIIAPDAGDSCTHHCHLRWRWRWGWGGGERGEAHECLLHDGLSKLSRF